MSLNQYLQHAKSNPRPSMLAFRNLVWSEMALLCVFVLATVAPLAFGFRPFDRTPGELVDAYHYGTLAVLAVYHVLFMLPLKGFQIHSWKPYLIGMGLMLATLGVWLSGADGRTLSFADLERGAVFSPLVFAFGLPLIHGMIYVLASNAVLNKYGAGDPTVPQPRV